MLDFPMFSSEFSPLHAHLLLYIHSLAQQASTELQDAIRVTHSLHPYSPPEPFTNDLRGKRSPSKIFLSKTDMHMASAMEYNGMRKGQRHRTGAALTVPCTVCPMGSSGSSLGWMASCTERGVLAAAGGERGSALGPGCEPRPRPREQPGPGLEPPAPP